MLEKIRVSVLTPSWNRADLLPRVWDGLKKQTGVNFEWVVGNDGSSDQTTKIVEEFAKSSSFPVTLISGSIRTGKSFIDNLLVDAARGDFIIWCDSDDVLNPKALAQLLAAWDDIPTDERGDYMGVSARAETLDGVLGAPFNTSADELSWNELHSRINSDLTIMARADLLKKTPFLEVDFLIPETSVWNIIGIKKTKFINHALVMKYYRQPNALSFTGKMQYNRGRAYALGADYQFVKNQLGIHGEFFRAVNFIRYCIHGDVDFKTACHIWSGSMLSIFFLVIGILPALALVSRDLWRGVVEKTHIEFDRNRKIVCITREKWEGYLNV